MNLSNSIIEIDSTLLERVDSLVSRKLFCNRAEVFQSAITALVERLDEESFMGECEKLDAGREQKFADIGLKSDFGGWPEY